MPAEIFSVVGRIVYEGADQLDRNLRSLDDRAQAAGAVLEEMGDSAVQATQVIDNLGQGASASLENVGEGAAAAAGTMESMGAGVDSAADTLERLQDELDQAAEAANTAASAVGSADRAARDAAANLGKAGGIMTAGFTAPIIAAGAAAFDMAGQVDESTDMLQAQLGLTAEEAENLSAISQDLWRNNFGADVMEASEAVRQVANNMLQIDDSEIQAAAESAFILRDAFGLELQESTSLADSIMANFGGTAEEAFDAITTGFQNGLDYGADFADTMREYGPIFAGMGMDINDALSFLQTAQSAGFRNLDVAADAFKEFSLIAQEGGEDFEAAVASMGTETQKLYQGFREGKVSGNDLFYGLAEGLGNIENQQDRFNAGVATMGTLFEDNGETAIMNMVYMRDELENVAGATEEAGAALYDNFTSNLATAMRTAQSALLPFGNMLLNVANNALPPLISGLQKAADWANNLSPQMQLFIGIFAALAAAAGPLLLALGFIVSNMSALVPLLTIITGPVGTIIVLMTALAAALAYAYTHSERFRNIVQSIFGTIAGLVQQGLGAAAAFIRNIWGQVVAWWAENNTQILTAARNVWNFLQPIIGVAMSLVVGTIKYYWGLATTIFKGAVNIITGIIGVFAAIFSGDWTNLWANVQRILKGGLQIIWAAIQLTLLGRIMGVARKFLSALTGVFRSLGTAITSRVTSMTTSMRNLFTGALNAVRNLWNTFVNWLRSKLGQMANFGITAVSRLTTGMARLFRDVLATARSIFNNIMSAITTPIKNAWNTVSGYITNIKNAFNKLKLKLPKIDLPPMPHINLTTGSKTILGKKITYPNGFDVEWYDQGGIFDSPSIIGVGENRPEFVGALDDLRQIVREEAGGGGGTITLNIPLYLNDREIARAVAPEIDIELARRQQRDARARGRRL